MKKRWNINHPSHKKNDPYYSLTRREQVITFRLRTQHNRLRNHLFDKFRIGDFDPWRVEKDDYRAHTKEMSPPRRNQRNDLTDLQSDV